MTMSNIKHFHSNLLKVDEKSYKDIDVYYIGYITIKKFGDWENIQCKSVVFNNSLCYWIFYRKDNKKYLIVDSTDKYKEVWSGITSKIKTLDGGKELYDKKTCQNWN